MLAVLSSPTLFAIGAMLFFYASLIALAYQKLDKEGVDISACLGTTGGAVLMVGIFAASVWLVSDMDTDTDHESVVETELLRRTWFLDKANWRRAPRFNKGIDAIYRTLSIYIWQESIYSSTAGQKEWGFGWLPGERRSAAQEG
jgi:hypothetical protein